MYCGRGLHEEGSWKQSAAKVIRRLCRTQIQPLRCSARCEALSIRKSGFQFGQCLATSSTFAGRPLRWNERKKANWPQPCFDHVRVEHGACPINGAHGVRVGSVWGARGVGVGPRQKRVFAQAYSLLLTPTIRKTSDAGNMGPARRYRP